MQWSGGRFARVGDSAVARVLVVDDDSSALNAMTHAVVRLGFDVSSTSSPVVAIGMVSADPPDVIVADYLVPEMDGITMVNQIATALGDRCPPVLFVSGRDIANMRSRLPSGLRCSFLTKPVERDDLDREIRSLLRS